MAVRKPKNGARSELFLKGLIVPTVSRSHNLAVERPQFTLSAACRHNQAGLAVSRKHQINIFKLVHFCAYESG